MSGNPGGLSERLCYLLSECWKGSHTRCRNAGRCWLCQICCRNAGCCRFCQLYCRNAGCCRLSQTVERCKIFESKVLPYCFEKIFDRGRSVLILIPQIRDLGSCFVEFLQSSFRCFLIDDAFFLTVMFQVVLLTEYHASNRTERLH